MRNALPIVWGALLLLSACGQHQPPADAPSAPKPGTTPVVAPTVALKPSAYESSAQIPAAQLYGNLAAAADTVLRLSGRAYRLSWQVRLDTLQPLTHITPPDPATYFAGDTSRGFQGYYKVEVRDSLGHRVGSHSFTKADFYPAIGPELAISSEVELPQLLGYSEPLGGLVFTVAFNAPGTDWYGRAALVLAPSGQVRYLGPGTGSDGPRVEVTLAADGLTLLTEKEIRHAGRPPIPVKRAGAELRGAMLLNDTLALLIYEPGRSRPRRNEMPYFEATAAQRRQPNAFVLDVRSNHEVSRFRYDGFYYELGYVIPMQQVPQAHAVYLLDADKGLYVLPLRRPTTGRLLPFATLRGAAGPPAAGEISFELTGPMLTEAVQNHRFWVDTAHATLVRHLVSKD